MNPLPVRVEAKIELLKLALIKDARDFAKV
jgi:hypothetical protein